MPRRWDLTVALLCLAYRSTALSQPRRRRAFGSDEERRLRRLVEEESARRARQATEEFARLQDLRLLNEAFRESGLSEEPPQGLALNTASWCYAPGVREIIHAHRPEMVFLFEDVLLRSEEPVYVHALRGSDIGCLVRVVDVKRDEKRGTLYALVHAERRVRFTEDASSQDKRGPVRYVQVEDVYDEEESPEVARAWAGVDDVSLFKETWLRDGVFNQKIPDFSSQAAEKAALLSPPADNEEAADGPLLQVEAQVWAEIDMLVGLIRQSRTSGTYDLPPTLLALRDAPASYPASRRAFRTSFSLGFLLDLDRASERQATVEVTSTKRRLAFIRDRLRDKRLKLAAALAIESIRKKNS